MSEKTDALLIEMLVERHTNDKAYIEVLVKQVEALQVGDNHPTYGGDSIPLDALQAVFDQAWSRSLHTHSRFTRAMQEALHEWGIPITFGRNINNPAEGNGNA